MYVYLAVILFAKYLPAERNSKHIFWGLMHFAVEYSLTWVTYKAVMTGREALMPAAILHVVKFPIRYTTKKLI
jgi:hypothetical protein